MTAITVRQGSDLATFLPPAYLERVYESVWSPAPTGQTRSFAISFIHYPKQGLCGTGPPIMCSIT